MSQYITVRQQSPRTPRSLPGDYRISGGDSSVLSPGLCSSQLPSFSSSKPVADPEQEEGCFNLVMRSNLYLSQHTVGVYLKNCIHILKKSLSEVRYKSEANDGFFFPSCCWQDLISVSSRVCILGCFFCRNHGHRLSSASPLSARALVCVCVGGSFLV